MYGVVEVDGFEPDIRDQRPHLLTGPIVNPANGHVYFLLDCASWTKSQAEANRLGGHLVTINDQAENDWVYDQFSRMNGELRNLWIGLNDAQSEGAMQWASGQTSDYTNWSPAEPNNVKGEEHFAAIWGPYDEFEYVRLWNDLPDDGGVYQVYGVVEIELKGLEPLSALREPTE